MLREEPDLEAPGTAIINSLALAVMRPRKKRTDEGLAIPVRHRYNLAATERHYDPRGGRYEVEA
jgi:hypothetical protein